MPVFIVPHEKLPRCSSQVLKASTFRLQPELFPVLPGSEDGVCLPSTTSYLALQSWASVVEYGISAKFHGFMQLPLELRLAIWKLALGGQLGEEIEIRDSVRSNPLPIYPRFLPRLCYTSKRTMEETIAVVIEGSRFMVASINDNHFLQAFLGGAPGRFERCRQLNFDYFSRYPGNLPANQDLELAVRCTGLRTIRLNFHVDELTYFVVEGQYATRHARKAAELFEKYKLKRLVDCDMLQKIIIEHGGYFSTLAEEAAERLGKLLGEEFANKSPKHVVEVVVTRQPSRSHFWY